MAFFSFRKGTDSPAQASEPADPIETIRRKAKQRLIGSVVLVLAAVIGLPILFDAQPRPVPVDIAIEIPDKNKVAPLALPAPQLPASVLAAATQPAQALVPAAASVATPALVVPAARHASKVATGASLDDKEELVPNSAKPKASVAAPVKPSPAVVAPAPVPNPAPVPVPAPVKPPPVAKPALSPAPAPVPAVAAKPATKPDDGARARALLEGQPVPATTSAPTVAAGPNSGRFVVQVGAFADAAKAREVRAKLEKAGLKTYTQVVDSEGGQRTRVRVGPFDNKQDAATAADKIKALDLAGSVLAL